MERSIIFLCTIFFGIFGTLSTSQAQDSTKSKTEVVTYFECDFGKMDSVVTLVNEQLSPYYNKLVEQGKFKDWNLYRHDWGDSWNIVITYTTENKSAFFESFRETLGKILEEKPEVMGKFFSMCPKHKDNIYVQVGGHDFSGSKKNESD